MHISIALATHNGRIHLEKQLQSLLQQTYPPREIIISDDGSTDGTLELLDKYCREHSLITVLHSEKKGINNNFENAAAHCGGEYIAFCDQDDIWADDKLAQLVSGFTERVLLTYGVSILIDENDRQLPVSAEEYLGFQNYRTGHLPFFFYFSNCISGHTMMVRKKLVECALPFPDTCMYDQWLALIASVKSEIIHVPEACTFHRIHSFNTINNQEKNRARKKRMEKPLKYEKFSKHRAKHLVMLEKGLLESETLIPAEREDLSRLLHHIRTGDKKFFNIWLYLLLLRRRHQLFHGNQLRECRNRSLGGRYFKLLDLLSSSH